MASKKDYFGLSRLASIILAIIPFTSWLLGAATRFQEKKYIACIIRLVFGFTIVWILDIFFMFTDNRILRILDC